MRSMVRRGIYILLLVTAMLGAHAALSPLRWGALREVISVAVALGSGGVGLLAIVSVRRKCDMLARALRGMIEAQPLSAVDGMEADPSGLAGAINELIAHAQESI